MHFTSALFYLSAVSRWLSDVDEAVSCPSAIMAANTVVLRQLKKEGFVQFRDFYDAIEKFAKIVALVEGHFPGAMDSQSVLDGTDKVLKHLECDGDNTLFAQSLCPDEINHAKGDLADIFHDYMGEVFHLGGLAGVPFTGKTGFAAYSHHVSEGGNLFILFGPHIGVDETMQLGKYGRIGQSQSGAACGAAVGALSHCRCCADDLSSMADTADYQMNFLKAEIQKRLHLIDGAGTGSRNDEQAALATQVFDICRTVMDQILSQDVHGRIILLGGIQINMPEPMGGYFQPLLFESITDGRKEDHFELAFGPRKITIGKSLIAKAKRADSVVEEKVVAKAKTSPLSKLRALSKSSSHEDNIYFFRASSSPSSPTS